MLKVSVEYLDKARLAIIRLCRITLSVNTEIKLYFIIYLAVIFYSFENMSLFSTNKTDSALSNLNNYLLFQYQRDLLTLILLIDF